MTQDLDDGMLEFWKGPLAGGYPLVWIDVIYEKVRISGRVVAVAIMIAYGVNSEGQRGILAVEPMWDETEDSWRDFRRQLKRRVVKRVKMFTSEAHQGIQQAIKKEWLGAMSKRCQVHFMRNILVKVASRDKARLAKKLKQI